MERSLIIATLVFASSIAGCNPKGESTSTAESSNAADKTRSPDVKSPAPDIESRIVAKEGAFRFVVCRASNLHGLAISRRDSMAERDTALLLKEKLTNAISDFAEHQKLSGLDADKMANDHFDIFEKLAQKMSVEAETSADLGDAYAAYRIATISHDEILAAIAPLHKQVVEQFSLATEDQRELPAILVSKCSVGWAGNDNDFVFEGWTDPKAKSPKDGEK